MAKAKGRLANWDIASLYIAAAFAMIAANLTFLVASYDSDLLTAVLFRPMWPGLYSAFLLTGQGDPTPTQESIGPYLASSINAVLYAGAVLIIRLLFRQLLLPDPPKNSTDIQRDTP
jgi:hypothetical protein